MKIYKRFPIVFLRMLMVKGISTVIATILMLLITIALASFAYTYLSGVLTAQTAKTIELVGGIECTTGTSHIITVRNIGTTNIPTGEVAVTVDGTSATCTWSGTGDLVSGGTARTCTTGVTGVTTGSHKVRVLGPGNSLSGTSFCP